MSRDYLTTADILALHDALIRLYGGAEGVRDMGAVEAAVFRPQCGYYADEIQEACALLESLLMDHPFVDGNKRTAFAACDVFLRINGLQIQADADELFACMHYWISLVSGQRFQAIEAALRSFVVKI